MDADVRALYAERAGRAYAAMQRTFGTPDGGYRRDGWLHARGSSAHLWPLARALVATLDLAGVETSLRGEFDADAAIAARLDALERYWDPESRGARAYSSDVIGSRTGGDVYYDDNAWVALALVQLERMRPESGWLERARELFEFAVDGWDGRANDPHPGGVYWVQQGRGVGAKNHDRNTVSTAPNAELGLHLAELTGGTPPEPPGAVGAREMYDWVLATLDASRDDEEPGTGLFWDKIRGDGSVDRTIWTYNQGSMIGASVLLARAGGDGGAALLGRAEAIARKALGHFGGGGYVRQPPAFNAIFFRNLLMLHDVSADAGLRGEIVEAIRGYADFAWARRRDRRDRFHFSKGGVTLLHQSAFVQVFALLAWDPAGYRLLA